MAPSDTSPSDLRVVVADDDGEHRMLVGDALQFHGCSVVLASDGAEATRFARNVDPHLIFLDLEMPGISGWDALPSLRALASRPRIVAVSARDDARSRRRAFELGCHEFIAKPCTVDDICGLVSAFRFRRG